MHTHEQFMYRALFLASKGLPAAMPNPSVGAVIVHKDTIIGEGYTSSYGESLIQKGTCFITVIMIIIYVLLGNNIIEDSIHF